MYSTSFGGEANDTCLKTVFFSSGIEVVYMGNSNYVDINFPQKPIGTENNAIIKLIKKYNLNNIN